MDCGLRTTDYGLGINHGLGYKTRTKHYGLGIKYGLGYKTRTEHYGLGIKQLERFYIEWSLARTSFSRKYPLMQVQPYSIAEKGKEDTEGPKLTSCMNFPMIQPWLNVLKDQQSRELRRIRTICPAVYLYDTHIIRPWQNEEQKVDK